MKSIKNLFFIGLIALVAVITFAGCDNPTGDEEDNPYTEVPIPDANDDTLASALAWISGNAVDWGAYTITLKAGETSAPRRLSYEGKQVSITLKGDAGDREVRLSSNGSLFTVESGVMLNVENLTLKGRGNSEGAANDSALVQVNAGGVLKLKTGAVITGNYNPDNDGGGVNVNENAIFAMEGGEIKGNTAKGGVGVNVRGTFIIKDGTISGNTATEHGGGGVNVNTGIFTMEGGTISGNTANDGGGVNVHLGTFIMEGGTISGNTATEWDGGGVNVGGNGTFTMKGGTISDNTAAEVGGGVAVGENAAFTMEGGTISGNTATQSGGGVNVWKGTFIMKGGMISGNTAK
ncbi:MAG: hypothetical protein LBP42_07025, partial [Treponema sp.]|nr:hypothetical protein [Treponema sp.]